MYMPIHVIFIDFNTGHWSIMDIPAMTRTQMSRKTPFALLIQRHTSETQLMLVSDKEKALDMTGCDR